MRDQNKWVTILASVGIGAATYFTMSKNRKGLKQTMQNMIPFVSSQMLGNDQSGSQLKSVQSNA